MRYAPDEDLPEPLHLKRLRWMVMALLVVLMVGILTIAGTIVMRLGFAGAGPSPVAAEGLILPEGDILSTGQGEGTVLFVVRRPEGAEVLYVFDADTGAELSATAVERE
ncbi:MAG: DUF6476 family protein [Pseudomonadota bacterium]